MMQSTVGGHVELWCGRLERFCRRLSMVPPNIVTKHITLFVSRFKFKTPLKGEGVLPTQVQYLVDTHAAGLIFLQCTGLS